MDDSKMEEKLLKAETLEKPIQDPYLDEIEIDQLNLKTPPPPKSTRSRAVKTPNAPEKPKRAALTSRLQELASTNLVEHAILQGNFDRSLWHFADTLKSEVVIREQLLEFRKQFRLTTSSSLRTTDNEANNNILQVHYIKPDEIRAKISKASKTAHKDGFSLPSRPHGSRKFNPHLDSWVQECKPSYQQRATVASGEHNARYYITNELLKLIHRLCSPEADTTHMWLREVYYTDTTLFGSPKIVSEAVNDICCMFNCTRSSLLLFGDSKGVVYGDISFKAADKEFHGLSSGCTGLAIPSNTDSISDITSRTTLFILVVEKHTILQRLAQDGFCDAYNSIMITGKGMPDVATRVFLNKISISLELPVFAFVDFNPYGFRIYSAYRHGSRMMAYDRENLTTLGIKLLGLRSEDLVRFEIPERSVEKLSIDDIKTADDLLGLDCMEDQHEDLKFMKKHKKKIQIEALYVHGVRFPALFVLPLILQELTDV